jgi:hypothetical protein
MPFFFGSSRNSGDAEGGGRRGAEPSAPTLAAQTVLRVSYRRGRCAARVLIGLRPLHLCGTRLEGGHRRLSRALRCAWVEPKPRDSIVRRHGGAGARKVFGNRVPATASASPGVPAAAGGRRRHHPTGSPPTPPYRRERPWCPPSRRVPHKWSGRRPDRYMGRGSGLPFRTRRTV